MRSGSPDALLRRDPWSGGVLTSSDYARTAGLVRKYADLSIGGVDASVIAVAERLGDVDVATTYRRHFHAVRKARGFTLHPAF